MKRLGFVSGAVSLFLVSLLVAGLSQAQEPGPQADALPGAVVGSSFTYQGQLEKAGMPVNDSCDFQFTLFDAASGGSQVGPQQTAANLAVDKGLFIAAMDFGAGAFAGDARWLEIAVRCPAGSGDYTTLALRQALTSAPYAQYSTASPWTGLSGVPAGFADGVDDNTTYSAGAGLTLLGTTFFADTTYLQRRVTGSCTAGNAIRGVNPDGSVTCEPVGGGGGNAWLLAGNAGTTPGTDYLGTSDTQALEIKVNGARALRIEPGAASPNLIGGYGGNVAWAGVEGVTIAGGGESGDLHTVTDSFCTISGGEGNWVGDGDGVIAHTWATIGGGAGNSAAGLASTVGGGEGNSASGTDSFVGGGWGNSATGAYATVGGGLNSTATGAQSTVAGGQHNAAMNTSATVCGGFTNTAGGSGAAVLGGANNVANGDGATIGGGSWNTAGGANATIAGGYSSIASNGGATVSGGQDNEASGQEATVGGGAENAAGGTRCIVAGGYQNTAAGYETTVSGGAQNTASGQLATVSGGSENMASGPNSTIPGGYGAATSHYAELAYAAGRFSVSGDAQTSTYVMRNTTWDETSVELMLDGLAYPFTIASGRTVTFDILVVGRSDAGASAGYQIQGVIENVSGATSFIGTPTVTTLGEDVSAWDVIVVADDSDDVLSIQVTGAASTTIRWVATARTVEVAW